MTGTKEKDFAASEYKIIGTRPVRHDGADKVTGRAAFGADIKLPGLLQGRILRSPYAHALIKSIDTKRAEALPGVMAVITAKDIWAVDQRSARQDGLAARYAGELDESQEEPPATAGLASPNRKYFRDHYLASDKVLYCGHPVAAVAAIDQYVAEEAIKLIDVEYEELPVVLDVLEAMKESSPVLHKDLFTKSLGQVAEKPSNVAEHVQYVRGDPDKGLAEADVVLEREFRTTMVHQGYLEAHVATASWSPDGNLTVWSSHQGHFLVRDDIARLLQHPIAKIQVIPTEIGGGFGGKAVTYVQPVAAMLARKAGRPVRLAMSRAETFEATGPGVGCYIKLKMGATREGKITVAVAQIVNEAGAFPGASTGAMRCLLGPYEIPNGQVDGYDVVVNKVRSGPYRGPGSLQANFASETIIDEICERIGMDPLEFRLKNVAEEGSRTLLGIVRQGVGFEETMQAALTHEHYRAPLGGPNRGRGVACGWWGNAGGVSSCNLNVNGDGTVSLASGSVDLSGTRTTVAMQVAETLGIGVQAVRPEVADTNSVGYTFISGGSRTAFATGIAATEAAKDAIRQMKGRAALMWQVAAETVSYASGIFTTSADPSSGSTRRLTFKEVAAKLPITGGPISVSASAIPQGVAGTIGAHIVDVEVDPETGKVQVLRYTAVQDAGKAVHPSLVESQIQGGAVQGIGWALWEGYQYDERGRLLNNTFLDYRMPTTLDLPMIDVVVVEVENPGHPYGVKGVAETPITVPPAAIANAIHQAAGVRMRELPMTPDRILKEMGVIA